MPIHPPRAPARPFALLLGLVALVVALVVAPGARADGPSDAERHCAAVTEQVKGHVANKDEAGLAKDALSVLALHKLAADDKALRKKALALFSDILRAATADGTKVAALEALAEAADPDGASILKPYLSQRDPRTADGVLLAALKAARKMPDASLVSPLLKVFEKSKHDGAAREAMESLGYFREVKNHRVKIFETIVDEVRRTKPGVKGYEKGSIGEEGASATGEAGRSRWAALKQVVPPTLSRLTGRDLYGVTAEEWFTLADEYKGRTSDLFLDPK
jgi:hypothetical protein